MARRFILSDDITGNESDDVATLVFSANGKYYEIDLSEVNQGKFVKAIKPFVDKAREITDLRAKTLGAQSLDNEAAEIRAWAKQEGKEVSERGRISQELRDEYAAAMAKANSGESSEKSENGDSADNSSDAEKPSE